MSSYDTDMSRVFDLHNTVSTGHVSTPSSPNPSWESRYEELLQWRAVRGDTCVPKAEGALGRWVARQRELKRTGKLDPGREHALNSINFVWNTVTAMWEERFRRLSEWKRIHGHCAVPIAQGELGTWVSKQRQLRKRGKLSKEKVDALDSLKFTWSTAEADWEDKFKRLCGWTREHGHASVPFNEGELGWWVNTQRQCKRKGKLNQSREARLQTLGFVWNPSNSRSRAANTTTNTAVTSSAVTTPVSTPEKIETTIGSDVATSDILQLFADQSKEEPDFFQDNISPVSAEPMPCTEVTQVSTPPTTQAESLPSPQAALLPYNMWSPAILSSPMLNMPNMQMMSLPNPFSLLMPSVSQSFSMGQSVQCHSEALEQILSRDDGSCVFDQAAIDSLTCDEDL